MKGGEGGAGGRAATGRAVTRKSRLWLWFVGAFALQIGAWTAWFAIASRHEVREVPLATAGQEARPDSNAGGASEKQRAEGHPAAEAIR